MSGLHFHHRGRMRSEPSVQDYVSFGTRLTDGCEGHATFWCHNWTQISKYCCVLFLLKEMHDFICMCSSMLLWFSKYETQVRNELVIAMLKHVYFLDAKEDIFVTKCLTKDWKMTFFNLSPDFTKPNHTEPNWLHVPCISSFLNIPRKVSVVFLGSKAQVHAADRFSIISNFTT